MPRELLPGYGAYTARVLAARSGDLSRYRELLRNRVGSQVRVLHLGCGRDRSGIVPILPQGCEIHGIDLLALGHDYPGQSFVQGDAAHLPYASDCFDVVVCEYVFEHIARVDRFFAELSRVIRPEGALLALTPNRWSYKSVVAALTPHSFHQWAARRLRPDARSASDTQETHYLLNTRAAIHITATTHAFRVRHFEYVNNGPTWFAFAPGIFELGRLYHWLLDRWQRLDGFKCGFLLDLERRDVHAWLARVPPEARGASAPPFSDRRVGRSRARSERDRAPLSPARGPGAPWPR